MKIKCECGFEEIPDNFNAIMELDYGSNQRRIYIECPICGNEKFFQHFYLDTRMKKSVSHLLCSSLDEAKTGEEARKLYFKKLKELKKKYGRTN